MSATRNKPLIEIESEQKRLTRHFFEVVTAYVRIRSLSPIAAVNPDDEEVPNKQLNPTAIEFIVDVEAATTKALDNDQNLIKQWETLAYQEGRFRMQARSPRAVAEFTNAGSCSQMLTSGA